MENKNFPWAIALALVAIVIATIALFAAFSHSSGFGNKTASFWDALSYKVSGTEIVSASRSATFTGGIFSSSATTSVSLLSTSATQGVCLPVNPTSTATLMNLTFAATTTGQSTVGVIPVLRYGACP